jgi:uncharacterized coiled-coil protein SlyX
MINFNNKFKLIFIGLVVFFIPLVISADTVGQKVNFNVDPLYDVFQRENISATLLEKSANLYFYIDDNWWEKFGSLKEAEIRAAISSLSQEFNSKIYPILTSTFGSEWKPGIDGDEIITVLLHPMKENAKGYYRNIDEYPKLQAIESNQREMIYLNINYITSSLAKSFLAHEFQHLITFNQREKKFGISEDVWFQEMFSEYASTLLGYDDVLKGSYLEIRIKSFLEKPSDSLTEWQGAASDYGVVNLFTQYLVDYYGKNILIDALNSSLRGFDAFNYSLKKNGYQKDIKAVFSDWKIAVLVNDCSLARQYCYKNQNLANLKITPSLNFLPAFGKTSLTIENSIVDWSAQWYKLVGGKNDLKLIFDGIDDVDFNVSYYLCKKTEECSLEKLSLDNQEKGTITISNFGSDYSFLTLIISTYQKTVEFGSLELAHPFSLEISTLENEELIKSLLEKITYLQNEIAKVQAQIDAILEKKKGFTCNKFERDLFFGIMDSQEVRCLQEFLKSQGFEIYPEGLVTGNFLSATQSAVIRFQEKYVSEILIPLGLEKGTGFVGLKTRMKINQLSGK